MIQPKTVGQLQQILETNHVDTAEWGQGKSKSLADLIQEIQDGETVLDVNPIRRSISLVQIIIRFENKILIETRQEMANGIIRTRNNPPAEKMKPGEDVETAAMRCLREELNLSNDQVKILPQTHKQEIEERPSPSYPGLLTRYTIHTIEAETADLPQTNFSTEEHSTDHTVKKHFWTWLPLFETNNNHLLGTNG